MNWSIERLKLDLRYTWKISRNATDQKINLIVTTDDGVVSAKGEAAPNIRYDETPEKLLAEFDRFKSVIKDENPDHASLLELIHSLKLSHALSFAIESAFIHQKVRASGKTFSQYMHIPAPPSSIPVSYTIPIMDPAATRVFYGEEKLKRFPYVKLKINAETAFDCTKYLLSFTDVPVMIDANEGFKDVDSAIRYLEKIKRMPIVLVEQLLPADFKEETIYLKKYCPFPHFADETVTDQADFDYLTKCFDGINVKLMKAGSYANGIHLLKEARKNNLRTMIGCMVETTLGISSAMNLCGLTEFNDLDSHLVLTKEPFGLLKEENGELRLVGGKN